MKYACKWCDGSINMQAIRMKNFIKQLIAKRQAQAFGCTLSFLNGNKKLIYLPTIKQ